MTFSIACYIDSVPFTPDVVAGKTSLGGSESSGIGLMRALRARGHDVTIFATKLEQPCIDHAGVRWMKAEDLPGLNQFATWDVFVSLRMLEPFGFGINAKLRMLWSQDLLVPGQMLESVLKLSWALDRIAYVSQYHRKQWEGLAPELKPLGYVTRNGFDPDLIPEDVQKIPGRVIHVSRPERGLMPLLKMWPALRAKVPHATLAVCRYSSMYDKDGWGQYCAFADREVERVNTEVGGIIQLGELSKPDLYREIAQAQVMWYPGVKDFGETSCVAAIEAQACGTPIVASYKGALPETAPHAWLTDGDAMSPEYQLKSVADVAGFLESAWNTDAYGRRHVESYTYDVIAGEWESDIEAFFSDRAFGNPIGVMRQLLHNDDHTAAKRFAQDLVATAGPHAFYACDGKDVVAFCDYVIAGKDQVADQYAERAADPIVEAKHSGRFHKALPYFKDCTHVLDVACGSGGFALALALEYPDIKVTGIDYASDNITRARQAAVELGVSDRTTFVCDPVFDFDNQATVTLPSGCDGAFAGEIVEHIAKAPEFVDSIEAVLAPGSPVVITVPLGPMVELVPRDVPLRRGHVHHFEASDVVAMFGKKQQFSCEALAWLGESRRGRICGNWFISYKTSGQPTGRRDYTKRIRTTRPKQSVSVIVIAKNNETEIGKLLDSVWGIADEIIVGLCGSTDQTKAICEAFDKASLQQKVRTIDLPAVEEFEDGFAGARNAVLARAQYDWVIWADTDEWLLNPTALHQYLESTIHNAFVLKQAHLCLDLPVHADTPFRCFRRLPSMRFYGVVHEQVQMHDENGQPDPAMTIPDVLFVHVGNITEGIRRQKMLGRNRALLIRDRERFPHRRIGIGLWIRELSIMADEEVAEHGVLTPAARGYVQEAIDLFETHFANDPGSIDYAIARPFYDHCCEALSSRHYVHFALAGQRSGFSNQLMPAKFVAKDFADIERVVLHHLGETKKRLAPMTLDVEPIQSREMEVAHVAS